MRPGTLFVVATPIGNLGDLSDRAKEVLRQVDLVAAEDTRRTRILLSRVGVAPPILSFHAHSSAARLDRLLKLLSQGRKVALLSDAGTPAISDPGAALVKRAREAGVGVVAVPGPSAVAAALSVSGFPADRYVFLGFLPRKGVERRRLIGAASESPWTVVLFESAERLTVLLNDLAQACGGEREAAVARELTKLHEEVKLGTLNELAVYYRESSARGEVTVLVAGKRPLPALLDERVVVERAQALLRSGASRRDVAARVARELRLPHRRVYRMVIEL